MSAFTKYKPMTQAAPENLSLKPTFHGSATTKYLSNEITAKLIMDTVPEKKPLDGEV